MTTFLAITGALMMNAPGVIAVENGTFPVVTQGMDVPALPNISTTTVDLPLSTWVGPGDVIRIKAFPDTGSFLSGNYVIMDSGFVILPILGLMQVTKWSITGLTTHLTSGYAKYLAYPTIQIEPLIRLSMLGGFLRPGMHLVNPLYSFANALGTAGGTVRDDGLKLLRWERGGKILATNMTAESENPASLWSLGFKSGDQLCVTLRTERDGLQVAEFLASTIIGTATLLLTLLVVVR
jgi:protein involved in polysaccharide export with SLBB domain